jgi:hypothetical protein
MLEGFWTYLIPGTPRGGVMCVKNGTVTGGDNIAFFNGIFTKAGEKVTGTVLTTRFNDAAQLDGLWGETQSRYVMQFAGQHTGDSIIGRFSRPGLPHSDFELVMTPRGPAP